MIPAFRKQLFFGGMGKWKMPDVAAKRGHADNLTHIIKFIAWNYLASTVVLNMPIIGYDIEYSPGQLHDAERMLKAPVGRSGIHEVGHRQLMNMSETLKRTAVKYFALLGLDANEVENG